MKQKCIFDKCEIKNNKNITEATRKISSVYDHSVITVKSETDF